MTCSSVKKGPILDHQRQRLEVEMIGQERWAEIRRLHFEAGESISAIARCLELDRKTVRRCLQSEAWQPYQRQYRAAGTLLASHEAWLRQRAPKVHYSARILHQELKADHGFRGSYETVKRFVAPLRELVDSEALTQTRFETAPGGGRARSIGGRRGSRFAMARRACGFLSSPWDSRGGVFTGATPTSGSISFSKPTSARSPTSAG